MQRKFRFGLAALVMALLCAPLLVHADSTSQELAPKNFKGGMSVGNGGTLLVKVKCVEVADQDIPSAAAATTVVKAVTVTGVALGDALISFTPKQDDAAYDEGSLSAFIEAADTVKLVYHADATGGDPAATNDFEFCWIDFTP